MNYPYGRMEFAAYLAERYGPICAVRYHSVCAEVDRRIDNQSKEARLDNKSKGFIPPPDQPFRGKQQRTQDHPECPHCGSTWTSKRGYSRPRKNGETVQRYCCKNCKKSFIPLEDLKNETHYA